MTQIPEHPYDLLLLLGITTNEFYNYIEPTCDPAIWEKETESGLQRFCLMASMFLKLFVR